MTIWKGVLGLSSKYEVSNKGDVVSLNYNGTGKRSPLKLAESRGYVAVELAGKRFTVHRLVMEAFVCPRPPSMQINHINGVKSDNRLENLEYATASENKKHAFKTGLQSNRGESHSRSKLKAQQILDIRQALANGSKAKSLSKKYNVDVTNIYHIQSGRTWSHIE